MSNLADLAFALYALGAACFFVGTIINWWLS